MQKKAYYCCSCNDGPFNVDLCVRCVHCEHIFGACCLVQNLEESSPPPAHRVSTPAVASFSEDESHAQIGSVEAEGDSLRRRTALSMNSSRITTPDPAEDIFSAENTINKLKPRDPCFQLPKYHMHVEVEQSQSQPAKQIAEHEAAHVWGPQELRERFFIQSTDAVTESSPTPQAGYKTGPQKPLELADLIYPSYDGIQSYLASKNVSASVKPTLPSESRRLMLQQSKGLFSSEAAHESRPTHFQGNVPENQPVANKRLLNISSERPSMPIETSRPQLIPSKNAFQGEAAQESGVKAPSERATSEPILRTVLERPPAPRIEILRRIDPGSIRVNFEDSNSILDTFKYHVQFATGQNWDWWPLKPAQCYLRHGQVRISWECLCGETRSAAVPIKDVSRFRDGLSKSITAPHVTEGTPSQGQLELTEATTATTLPAASSGFKRQSTLHAGPKETRPLRDFASSEQQMRPDRSSQYLLFVVKAGSKHNLSQIPMEGITTRRFFLQLRTDYFGLRGLLRSLFSVWVYSHSDFYKFVKFDADAISPQIAHRFPDCHEEYNYEFSPKPMQEIPPIPEDEFKRRFYACYHSESYIHCLHQCYSINGSCNKVLACLPKRKSRLDLNSNERTYFWGLYAREAPAAIRVLVYSMICLMPVVIFFFMWLFSWKHGADLQNASVPLFATVAFLSIFWGILLSGLRNTEKPADVD